MPKLKQAIGQDYPAASRKHCLDARVLLDNQRYDGAAYLAGYAVECILKTIIQIEENHNRAIIKFKHDLEKCSLEALKLMLLPNSRTARYIKTQSITIITYKDPPLGWKETLRYYPDNTISHQIANDWVLDAERLYIDVIGGLMKDGKEIL